MFTRTGARPRVIAALTAVIAAAALALLPSLSAAADEGDLATLTASAAQARADANAAHDAAAAADADAAAAASAAAQAHADAAAACTAVTAAADALAGSPEDADLQGGLASAQATCDAANAAAGSADADAAAAAGAAASAHATANALEQVAVAAEAALAAAQSKPPAVQKSADDETTTDETTEETTEEESEQEESTEEEVEECVEESTDETVLDETVLDETVVEETDPDTTTDETTVDETTVEEGCGESFGVMSFDRRQNCDNRDMNFFSQNRDWDWCFPDPKIDIDVESYCPTVIEIEIENLWWWVDYTVKVNGEVYPITIDNHGKATITLQDWQSDKVEVKVYKDGRKIAEEKDWLDDKKCPGISVEIDQCTTIGGEGSVWVSVYDLSKWSEYTVTIVGPNGTVLDEEISWSYSWNEYLSLSPGSYTVTVFSDGGKHKPDVGPIVYTFEMAPCPGDVTITIVPTCGESGSLGAKLSGLVPGREYTVTVVGPNGEVTNVTFVATEPTWAVPPAHLPPGTYTVTVVDTASSSSGGNALKVEVPEYDPLTWTATGTIPACPALASTGSSPSSGLVPALALIPLGAGLLITSAMRRRAVSSPTEVDEEG